MACPPKPPPTAEDSCRLLRPRVATNEAPCPDVEFRTGNYQITYSLGCLKKSRVQRPIPNGWYNRVLIEDGQIVDVENDESRTTLLPDLCMNQVGGAMLEAPTTQCNMSQISGDQLMTRLIVATPMPQDAAWLDGCGSEGFPLKVNLNIEMLKKAMGMTGGVTVDSCEIAISGGAVTKFPNRVITGVVNNAPGVLEAFINDACELVISVPGYNAGTGAATPSYQASRPCQTGGGLITFGVYQGEQGRFYLRVISGGPLFTPSAPAYFETLAAAQAFIATAIGICSDPSGDPGGA